MYIYNPEYVSVSYSIFITSIILYSLIVLTRTDIINVLIVFICVPVYFFRSLSYLFYAELSKYELDHMNKINWFVNQESLEVTYWNLTSLLFFWFVGCFVTRKIKLSGNKFNIPSIFFKIDRVIYSRGKVLWAVVIFVTYFGYRTVDEKYSGIRNEGDGVPSFLYGLIGVETISVIFLVYFVKIYLFLNSYHKCITSTS